MTAFVIALTILVHAALRGTELGIDYYTFWLAGNATVLEHQNPYSADVTLQSQMGIYGRPAHPDEDQVAFAYPPYSLLVLIPTLILDFSWASALWLSINIAGLITLFFMLAQPGARLLSVTALLFYPVFFCLVTGNFSVFLAGIILFFFGTAAVRGSATPAVQAISGVLLAWATAKPQFVWLFLIFIVLFPVRRKMYIFLAVFITVFIALAAGSFAFVPNWLQEWISRLQEYAGYVQSRPTLMEFLRLFLPESLALIMTAAAFAACMGVTTRFFWLWWHDKLHWINVLAWVGLVTYLFHLHGIAYEQMTFLAPLFLWAGQQNRVGSTPVLVFWFGSILVSWLGFTLGMGTTAADRAPVLFSAVWVGWMFFQKKQV